MLISILYCLPVFFEYETVPATENRSATINETMFANSEIYIIAYYVASDAIIRFFLPVCILFCTNFTIHKIVSPCNSKFVTSYGTLAVVNRLIPFKPVFLR